MAKNTITMQVINAEEILNQVKEFIDEIAAYPNASVQFIDLFNSSSDLVCIDNDAAIKPPTYRLTLKFSDRFLEFIRAFRSGELND